MNFSILFQPTLSSLLKNRANSAAISGVITLHLTLVASGIPSWQCPMRSGLGIPCPGCGLSRAINELIQGNLHDAILIHAFAPLVILVILLIFVNSLIPNSYRLSLANRLEIIERSTGITNFILITLIGYWIIRLFFFRESLYFWVMM